MISNGELYRRAETLITADAPTVNLVYYTFERLFQPYVQGIEVNALGERHIPMKKIWLDRAHHAFPKTLYRRIRQDIGRRLAPTLSLRQKFLLAFLSLVCALVMGLFLKNY